jgi:hypothetical protein
VARMAEPSESIAAVGRPDHGAVYTFENIRAAEQRCTSASKNSERTW